MGGSLARGYPHRCLIATIATAVLALTATPASASSVTLTTNYGRTCAVDGFVIGRDYLGSAVVRQVDYGTNVNCSNPNPARQMAIFTEAHLSENNQPIPFEQASGACEWCTSNTQAHATDEEGLRSASYEMNGRADLQLFRDKPYETFNTPLPLGCVFLDPVYRDGVTCTTAAQIGPAGL
jgi:hypothetical protein